MHEAATTRNRYSECSRGPCGPWRRPATPNGLVPRERPQGPRLRSDADRRIPPGSLAVDQSDRSNHRSRCAAQYQVNDSHFHLTNYIQEGTDIRKFLDIMGTRVGRVALFGIPLQQQWSYRVSGDDAPTYYLDSDADLYYYSFTDAFIAMAYKSLTPEQQARFDPMITGFNPTDMYAADHIRRVLADVSRRVLRDRRVHDSQGVRLLEDRRRRRQPGTIRRSTAFSTSAGEVGLVVIIHNDIHMPFAKPEHVARRTSTR